MIFDFVISICLCTGAGAFAAIFVVWAWSCFEETRVGSLFVDWLEDKLKRKEE